MNANDFNHQKKSSRHFSMIQSRLTCDLDAHFRSALRYSRLATGCSGGIRFGMDYPRYFSRVSNSGSTFKSRSRSEISSFGCKSRGSSLTTNLEKNALSSSRAYMAIATAPLDGAFAKIYSLNTQGLPGSGVSIIKSFRLS